MARVFLTGGGGFVGGVLLERLVGRGDHVVALARSEAAARACAARGAAVVRGDVLDERAVAEGMAGCALAFHVAGINEHCPRDRERLLRVNVDGPAAAVRAAARAGVSRLVLTSSSTTIGEAHGTVATEETPHRGSYLSLYDRSKHHGERAALDAGREHGVEVVAVCPSSVQGPGRSGGTGAIILAYLNGSLRAFVDTHVSLVDVDDCASGHLLAAERGRAGRRYLLNGATLTSADALDVVAGVSGVREPVRMVPAALARTVAVVNEGVSRVRRRRPASLCRARMRTILHGHRYDASRSRTELGLDYRPVSETFARTIDWAAAEGLLTRPLPART